VRLVDVTNPPITTAFTQCGDARGERYRHRSGRPGKKWEPKVDTLLEQCEMALSGAEAAGT